MPWYDEIVLSYETSHIELKEKESIFVDNHFLEMFDFVLLQGNRVNVLTRPSTIVLTPALSEALFHGIDPIGKKVVGLNGVEFEVTGIIEEAPRNSHIQYKALMSFNTTTPQVGPLAFGYLNNWNTQTLTTYLLLHPGSDPKAVNQKLLAFTQAHIPTRRNSATEFSLAILITLMVTLLGESIQAIKAANMNPAEALRYE